MKLNHKEFRVGNLVEYDGRVFEIDSVSEVLPTLNTIEFGIGVVDWNNLKPIPLNEDWLVKLGFTKERNSIDSADLFIKKDIVFVLTGEHYTVSWNSVTINLIPAKVKFVHELQNLFYCLTGTELTITDK